MYRTQLGSTKPLFPQPTVPDGPVVAKIWLRLEPQIGYNWLDSQPINDPALRWAWIVLSISTDYPEDLDYSILNKYFSDNFIVFAVFYTIG